MELKLLARTIATAFGALLVASAFAAAASADTNNTNTNSQVGSNTAGSVQSAASASGDATADFGGTATSGDATATAALQQAQSLLQRASNQTANLPDCECTIQMPWSGSGDPALGNTNNVNANGQQHANALTSDQGVAAVSGIASANNGGTSTTGASASTASNIQSQVAQQIAHNQRLRVITPAP
jgi:hypothetical protein